MLKKLGFVALLATSLAGCYCGPAYGYGYGPRRAYAYAPGRSYGGWHRGYGRRW